MTQQNSPYNLPNAITVARILLVPLYIWLSLHYGISGAMAWWAILVFVLAIATDGVDGAIARRRGLITNLGKILDPIADKALTGAGFILMAHFGLVSGWIVALLLLREWGITAWRLTIARKRVVAASGGGKIKTILQAIVIPLMLSPLAASFNWIELSAQVLFWITVAVTLITGVQYLVAARKQNV